MSFNLDSAGKPQKSDFQNSLRAPKYRWDAWANRCTTAIWYIGKQITQLRYFPTN